MNTHSKKTKQSTLDAGFTLIEMIGVLAILSIFAAVITPNVLRSLDRAQTSSEKESMNTLGEQLKDYLSSNGTVPTTSNWTTELASFSDLSATQILTNPRNIDRVYIPEPGVSPTTRVLILSSLRSGYNLPSASNINNSSRFQTIWDTAEDEIPSTSSWSGWSGWSSPDYVGEFLIIERVNLASVYQNDLLEHSVSLNNTSGSTASYNIVDASGTASSAVNLNAGDVAALTGLVKNTRINLYSAASGSNLVYTFVVSDSGKTFEFDGTVWASQ